MEALLQLKEVSKRYGEKLAVDRVSFSAPAGQIFGLLGPNGAGKTSIIRMITTITQPDSGQIFFEGKPLGDRHQALIGYLPEERGLYKKMYVGEHLVYLARLKGMDKADARQTAGQWLEKFNLSDRWPQRIEELSKGLQQQVQFIATVLHRPRLIMLNEPFSGLDPLNTGKLKAEIANLCQQGVSIILSTHRMEQVEAICQRIALIHQGQNVLEGELEAVRAQFQQQRYRVRYSGPWVGMADKPYQCSPIGPHEMSVVFPAGHTPNDFLACLLAAGVQVVSFEQEIPSLNDIFISLVQ